MSAPPPMMLPPMMPGPTGTGGTQTVVIYNIMAPAPAPAKSLRWNQICTTYVLRPTLLVLLWACWVLYIAGTARLQLLCNSGDLTVGNSVSLDPNKFALLQLQPVTSGNCVTYFGLLWWSVFLQFTTLLLLTVTSITIFIHYMGITGFLRTCMYLFIMSTILLFFQASTYQKATYLFRNGFYTGASKNDLQAASALTVVGAITTLIFNFIYIIWNTHSELGHIDAPALPVPMLASAPGGPQPPTDGEAFVIPGEVKPKPAEAAAATHPDGAVPPGGAPVQRAMELPADATEAELESGRMSSFDVSKRTPSAMGRMPTAAQTLKESAHSSAAPPPVPEPELVKISTYAAPPPPAADALKGVPVSSAAPALPAATTLLPAPSAAAEPVSEAALPVSAAEASKPGKAAAAPAPAAVEPAKPATEAAVPAAAADVAKPATVTFADLPPAAAEAGKSATAPPPAATEAAKSATVLPPAAAEAAKSAAALPPAAAEAAKSATAK